MNKLFLEGHKLMYHPEAVGKFMRGEKNAPVIVEFSPAARCNQACEMCYTDYVMNDERSPRLMKREILFKAVKECAEYGVKAISMCGTGEPLINPAVPEAIVYAKELGMDICLISNGVLATPERMAAVLPCLSYFRVSVTAGEAERYAKTQGSTEHAFKKMMDNLEGLAKMKREQNLDCTIGVAYFVLPGADKDVIPYVKRLREIGVDYVQVKPLGDFEKNDYWYDKKYYRTILDVLKEVQTLSTDEFQVLVRFKRFEEFERFEESDDNPEMNNEKYTDGMPATCHALRFTAVIGSDGKVYTCGGSWYEERDCYGSLEDQTFQEIWESERFEEIWQRRSKVNKHDCFFACRNHVLNDYLMDLKAEPLHVNFI